MPKSVVKDKVADHKTAENKTILWMLFVVFGLLMLVIGYLVGSSYSVGNMNRTQSTNSIKKIKDIVAQRPATRNNNSRSITQPASPHPTSNTQVDSNANTSNETSEGEMKTTEKVDGYHRSFNITYPDDWSLNVDNTGFSTDAALTKDDFKITFRQADGGSSRCIYPDEADYGVDLEYPHVNYSNYAQFSSHSDVFRRIQRSNVDVYNLCSKNKGGTEFGLYTALGFVKYEVPFSHTQKQLEEMDAIMMSIEIL